MKRILGYLVDIRKEDVKPTLLLFVNIYLILLCYFIIKPVRGSLVISALGAKSLPTIWFFTAITITLFVAVYGKLIDWFTRKVVVSVTTFFFLATLLFQRQLLEFNYPWMTAVFYIWVDIFSVVMVEQFWIFTNDVFETKNAKRTYAIIASGGILGHISGSVVASYFVQMVGTLNLLYIASGFLIVQIVLTIIIEQALQGQIQKNPAAKLKAQEVKDSVTDFGAGFKLVRRHPYVAMLLAFVILTQVVSQVIDLQFNTIVEQTKDTVDGKTSFFSNFNLVLGITSLALMIFITGPVHRLFGVLVSLLVLPFANLFFLSAFLLAPIPMVVFALKLFDKSLNYSFYRATKEMLYIPTSQDIKYKAKAVIDMFGYRFSKIISSAILIPVIAYLSLSQLSILAITVLAVLVGVIIALHREYRTMTDPGVAKNLRVSLGT